MADYKYLIIGAGMTADAAVQGIREVDAVGAIGVIGDEAHAPYARPPLSKGLWQGKEVDSIWCGTAERGAELLTGRRVERLEPDGCRVVDDRGEAHGYERLLLATGATPRRLPFGGDRIIYFRTLDDYRRLRTLAEQKGHVALIGGGFIGSEVAAALAMNGCQVTLLFPSEAICDRIFPPDLAASLNDYFREQGVDVRPGSEAVGLDADGTTLTVRQRDSGETETLAVDGVVAGIGTEPNVALAEAAGLAVDNGVVVDATLHTAHPEILAAGDVAACDHPVLGRMRVEHEDNATTMGRLAGRNMAGEAQTYDHIPLFYSDLFDRGYEAVGRCDARLETVSDWQESYRKGVVYYLHEGTVRGVVLWNVWDQADHARSLLTEPGPFTAEDLRGRLPCG